MKGKTYAVKKSRSPESKTSKRRIESVEHEKNALALRIGGATYAVIGEALGLSESGSARAVYRALDRIKAEVRETAAQYVQLELERLDKMVFGLWSDAIKGRYGAVDRVLKIMERRARLLGLDAPTAISLVDWRAEVQEAGLNPSEIFEGMVAAYIKELEDRSPK